MPTYYDPTVIRNNLVIPMQGGGKFTVSPIKGLEMIDSRGRVAFSVSAEGHVSIGANASYGNTSYLNLGGSAGGADVSFGFRINGGVLEYRDNAGNWIALNYYGDHGNLTGLADDDHTQYILVDGTRAFTGEVAGVDPTSAASLATKNYVDGMAYVPTARTISTTAPLTGGGDLSADRTFAIDTAYTPRERLTAARTYYVRTDGNDSNTGLVDSSAGAFLTVQAAINAAMLLDLRTYNCTIQIRDGTYSGAVTVNGYPVTSGGQLIITGNSGTPTNVVLSNAYGLIARYAMPYPLSVTNLQVASATIGLYATGGSLVTFSGIDFGACGVALQASNGANITALGNYTVSGNATNGAVANFGAVVILGSRTVTYSNNPAYTTNFYAASLGRIYAASMTFTNGNTVTGKRYDATLNAVIDTGGGGANYVPGNAAGTTATGGQYA